MSEATNDAAAADFRRTWRYKIGLALIIVGNLGILLGFALGIVGVDAAAIGVLVLGGEIVSLASIVFLGSEGFKVIKSRVVGFAKSTYREPAGRVRHRIGIGLLLIHVATAYLMAFFAWEAFAVAMAEGADAAVWGLTLAEQGELVFKLFLIGEVTFLVSLYVLGADWWGRFRRIFVWEAGGATTGRA